MMSPSIRIRIKRSLIFLHRWVGASLCLLFLLWFASGIVMMYWDFPSVRAEDRLERSPRLDAPRIQLSPEEAFARLKSAPSAATQVRLNTFDGRPVYRLRPGREDRLIYADTGEEQIDVTPEMAKRIASAWTAQPAAAAKIESVNEIDQWTVQGGLRNVRPLWEYSWPNGEQVYISGATGEVVQYTTITSRFWAYLGAIPHWLYFTPLRKHAPQWSKFVIYASGMATVAALLGIVVGVWMYSPEKRYKHAGMPTSIPYRGQKRWHTILGLIFGTGAVTWAFSGMLSMDPFPAKRGPSSGRGRMQGAANLPRALRDRLQLPAFQAKHPREALKQLGDIAVEDLELISFGGEPAYIASAATGETRIIPIHGQPLREFGADRVVDLVTKTVAPGSLAGIRLLHDYDAYYLDRHHQRPLPVVLVSLNDAQHTRYYIDAKTARVVGSYSSRAWV